MEYFCLNYNCETVDYYCAFKYMLCIIIVKIQELRKKKLATINSQNFTIESDLFFLHKFSAIVRMDIHLLYRFWQSPLKEKELSVTINF